MFWLICFGSCLRFHGAVKVFQSFSYGLDIADDFAFI